MVTQHKASPFVPPCLCRQARQVEATCVRVRVCALTDHLDFT